MDTSKPATIDEYIAGFPPARQEILQKVRQVIREAAPDAAETIKYQIPTFTLQGNLVSFAAYKNHIGLYPAPAGDEALQQALSAYKAAKSTIQFPFAQPIPYDLIGQIVAFRVKEHLAHVAAKKNKRGNHG